MGPGTPSRLRVVDVAAPDVNYLFDSDGRITVDDSTAPITVPASTGEGFLQSRTWPPGQAGTDGESLIAYLYRIDLREIAAITGGVCIQALTLPFGPVEGLDYDRSGGVDHVFVVRRGGIGSVAPASVEQDGDLITFHFRPDAICPGSSPGRGESSFFFGLASRHTPRRISATLLDTTGGSHRVEARAPAFA